jgi:predicted lipoprotein with Yx(FWY)xxD motif
MKPRFVPRLVALSFAAVAAFGILSISLLSSASAGPSAGQPIAAGFHSHAVVASYGKASATVVSTRHTSLGTILVGPNGHTLYLFDADTKSHSTCTGSCASTWPPLTTSGAAKASGGVQSSLLGVISRPGGKQVTYAGHPLYYFAADKKAGETDGEGVHEFGALWQVLSTSGKAIVKG